ncbi:hypothetical protein D9757_000170 [Collybiopsis confluens]|uniref:WD40 repeat-like protein n=1 Tax=Collybiopsis confluens TaxID=2823264 RepID=A0A8H5I2C7_9AGAR|nr:hypothetical protein D9757_000170 [Collybiopsis confluens]
MRVGHTTHSLPAFPIYSSAFISQHELVVGGGGGASKSGIKNKLRVFNLEHNRSIELIDEFELASGEDAPMSMATDGQTIVCGVNSALESLKKGENENCRIFNFEKRKLSCIRTKGTLAVAADDSDYQKVTVLSPDGSLLVVAGAYDFTLLSYPSLELVALSVKTDEEIYDATFSQSKASIYATSLTLILTFKRQLIVATTANLQIFSLPGTESNATVSPKPKKKGKQKVSSDLLPALIRERVIDSPPSLSGTFRAAKTHPSLENTLYTAINTTPSRARGKSTPRQAYVSKWNTDTWTVEKTRKIGDRGLTCFSVSPDGKLLGYGSSDLSIGLLDATTLNPVSTILKAHEFPPTTLAFNTNSRLLVSGSADNSIRVISLPAQVKASNWGFMMVIVLTLIIVLLALAVQKYY